MDPEQSEANTVVHAVQRDFALRTWNFFAENMESEISQMEFHNVIDFGCETGDITTDLAEWISKTRFAC